MTPSSKNKTQNLFKKKKKKQKKSGKKYKTSHKSVKSNPILSGGGRKKKRKKEGNGGHDTTMTTNRLERPLHHHTVRVVRRCYGATVSTPDTLPPITFQWQRLCAGSGLNHLLHSSSIHSQIIQIQSLPNVLIARKSQFKVKSFK